MKRFLPKTVNNPQGFTLVELLVVISIIAILTVIGITIFTGQQRAARDAKRKADIDAIAKALESHYNQEPDQYCEGSHAGTYCTPLDEWFAGGSSGTQGTKIPKDPSDGQEYLYSGENTPALGRVVANITNGATWYKICADLEGKTGASGKTFSGLDKDYCLVSQQGSSVPTPVNSPAPSPSP